MSILAKLLGYVYKLEGRNLLCDHQDCLSKDEFFEYKRSIGNKIYHITRTINNQKKKKTFAPESLNS